LFLKIIPEGSKTRQDDTHRHLKWMNS
jgi:hypothetical protein